MTTNKIISGKSIWAGHIPDNSKAWQPISTAPREGDFLVSNGEWVRQASRSCLGGDWDVMGHRWPADIDRLRLTHWMPLPKPPL